METKQIKSRNRVSDYGEVFTRDQEVNDMLNMIEELKTNIESTVLEPACGDGNFLIEVLKRKMNLIEIRYKRLQNEFEKWSFIAISSLYGVDLLEDNVIQCRNRLFNYVDEIYKKLYKKKCNKNFEAILQYILSKNILCGNALTMRKNNDEPIIFSEWPMVSGELVKRSDYTLSQLLDPKEDEKVISDNNIESYINIPIKEYKPINYRRLIEYEQNRL